MEKKQFDIKKTLIKHIKHGYYQVEMDCKFYNCNNYIKKSIKIYDDDITDDLDTLMLAYFSMSKVPEQWGDMPIEFGGHYIAENKRFNRLNDKYNWLYDYTGYICGGIFCQSIINVKLYYYDENANLYQCEFPNLGELFSSEQEFIDYVRKWDDEINNEIEEETEYELSL